MKKLLLALGAATALSLSAQATQFLEESFPYATGSLSGKGGWTSGSAVQVVADSLAHPGLSSPLITSNKVNLTSSAGTAYRTFSGAAVSSGSVYLSFLLKQTTLAASTTGGTVAGLDDDGSISTSNGRVAAALGVHVKQTNSNSFIIGIRKGQGASGAGGGTDVYYPDSTFGLGQVVFVVARYTFGAGSGDDTVTLWVNPSANSFNAAEPAASIAATDTGNTSDAAQLQYVFVRANSSTTSGVNEVDDVRVGSAWADVTPNGGATPPEPTAQPRIREFFLTPEGLVLRGTNGPASGVYRIVGSPSLTIPLANWPAVATNLCDGNGNFAVTNPVPPGEAQRFYRLLVGGTISQPPGTAPEITLQPTNLTVLAGETASFYAAANGSAPLAYQWFFNTNTPLAGATNLILAVLSADATNEGSYSLRVTNSAGAVTSLVATLTVNVPPVIQTQPANQSVLVSNSATFTVVAAGDAPLRYQWYFNTNTALTGATNSAFSLALTQTNDAGIYSVIVTNAFGAATSTLASLTVNQPSTNTADFDLYGFGAPTIGGGLLPETDPNYRKVYTPGDLRLALANNNTKVIEIMNDLHLGWNEIGATNQTGAFRVNATPLLHPVLLTSGVTLIDVQNKNGLTIFSANGATLRHAEFNLKRTHNVLIRNLKFDELWEWDEATKGDYDSKDWDFITIGDSGNCTNVWIDHCDFTKSYDGAVDVKGGANTVTISWCRFLADDGGPDSFVRQQFLALETNGVAAPMFHFLRDNGFSLDDLVAISRSQKKGHLAGATEFDSDNANIKLTLHHNYYLNFQDRMPRLRAGNAHVYNCYQNNSEALAAKNLRDAKVAAISGGLGSYKFDVTLQAAISTEDGALLVERCHIVDTLAPLRNNQVNAADASYTGKIRAEDTIYTLNGSTFRGNTEDAGSTLVPVPAPSKPFSWNGFTTLPYSYPVDDPATIAATITSHAGQGMIFWAKTNWLRTSY